MVLVSVQWRCANGLDMRGPVRIFVHSAPVMRRKEIAMDQFTNAGFVVGGLLPKGNGILGTNPYAGTDTGQSTPYGRTHFLGVIMKEANSSGIFTDAGLNAVQPILRGVIMAPSGVVPALSASRPSSTIGEVPATGQSFKQKTDFTGNNLPLGAPNSA